MDKRIWKMWVENVCGDLDGYGGKIYLSLEFEKFILIDLLFVFYEVFK